MNLGLTIGVCRDGVGVQKIITTMQSRIARCGVAMSTEPQVTFPIQYSCTPRVVTQRTQNNSFQCFVMHLQIFDLLVSRYWYQTSIVAIGKCYRIWKNISMQNFSHHKAVNLTQSNLYGGLVRKHFEKFLLPIHCNIKQKNNLRRQ